MRRLAALLAPASLVGLLLLGAAGPGPPRVAAAPVEAADPDPATAAAFRRIMAFARDSALAERPYGEIVQAVGRQLLGAPYVAGMLDAPGEERLVVSLAAFDCVLYVENVLALARAVALGDTSYASYARNVEDLRYRGGMLGPYCRRLHYFTDWIRDNERRGNVRDVTREAGGVRYAKTVAFMTAHRTSYAPLADAGVFACIADVERDLRDHALFYIPQDRIAASYDHLRPGDIIATATSIAGLDVTHTGFVYRTARGGMAFLNASTSGDVRIAPDLARYVQGVRAQTGILVVRPVDPRE